MNPFDISLLFLMAFLGFTGFREGLIRGGIRLAGFILTTFIMTMFSGEITGFALGLRNVSRVFVTPVVFIIVFTALMILFRVIAEILHRTVHLTPLGMVDSGFGMVFGLVKALFVAGVAALILSFFPAQSPCNRLYAASRTAPKLVTLVRKTIPPATTAGARVLKYFPRMIKSGVTRN